MVLTMTHPIPGSGSRRFAGRAVWLLCAGALVVLAAGSSGCRKHVNFGKLPRLEVPLGKAPPKADPPGDAAAAPEEAGSSGESQGAAGDLPDPPAGLHRAQVRLTLSFERGEFRITDFEELTLTEAVRTPRRVGRFAAELWRGQTLLERVRFDFPLLGAEGDDDAIERGLSTRATVQVPHLTRPNRLRILDRKTRREVWREWPLESAQATSGGSGVGSGGSGVGSGRSGVGSGGSGSGRSSAGSGASGSGGLGSGSGGLGAE